MVRTVEILGRKSIHVGWNMTEFMADSIISELPSQTYALITDSNIIEHPVVEGLEAGLRSRFTDKQQRLFTFEIPPGELSKSSATKSRVEQFLLQQGCTRDTVILAVGGGVVGDMIGYVAATFMRGVRYVQIPTTLLAMVDSSIGGKTAIDTPEGKNLVGAFWQPSLNLCELAFLETLPEREFINGMAEVIKTAAIWDADEFSRLEGFVQRFWEVLDNRRDNFTGRVDLSEIRDEIERTVLGSVRVKSEVVTKDEREGGLRNILNFGHSIGHAYEAEWTPNVLHGECVAIGMVLEAELSRYLGKLGAAEVSRLTDCIQAYRLPTTVHDITVMRRVRGHQPSPSRLLDVMAIDKKNAGRQKMVVLLRKIGQTAEPKASSVSDEDLRVILSPEIAVGQPTDSPEMFQVVPPGSKSISNRVLVLAALGTGTVRISNLLHSDDVTYMRSALSKLQACTTELEDDSLIVHGRGGIVEGCDEELYLGNAGTASRFLTAVCACLSKGECTLTGNKRMQERPIGPLIDTLTAAGASVRFLGKNSSLPLQTAPKDFRGGRIELEATVSSQYVSALLMVAPYASQQVELVLKGKPISQLYIDMTIQMMSDFGINVEVLPNWTYRIPQGKYKNPEKYAVESDASSATYPLALAAILGAKCTVPTVGSRSLQGDARFAVDVLRPMGCTVEQTSTSTTVQGPPRGKLQALSEVDMEPMTDAFLTAAIVAAVAKGTTRITGIANQRVKECNRIEAMRTGLGRLGIKTTEFEDGMTVTGIPLAAMPTARAELDSYDDHRVAMSLSLLATQAQVPMVITERRTVEKTWPGWWDTLHFLNVPLEGYGELADEPPVYPSDLSHSIILIGMRGAGKTSTGTALAAVLGWEFKDMDIWFEEKNALPVREFVAKFGWEEFRVREHDLLKCFLRDHPQGWVIACGGGIVETSQARETLKQWNGSVVHVHRNLDKILGHLVADVARPSLGEDPVAVYTRREPLYDQCSNKYYFSGEIESLPDRQALEGSLRRLFHPVHAPTTGGFFVSLTYSDLSPFSREQIAEVTEGCVAIELRVDLLRSQDPEFVAEQVGLARLRTHLPIIYTVRTQGEGGRFRDDDIEGYIRLTKLAFKMGVEYVDIEVSAPRYVRETLRRARDEMTPSTLIIASHHDPQGLSPWSSLEWHTHFFYASRLGDIVKFVGFAENFSANLELEQFRASLKSARTPLIALNMGAAGKLSRVLNPLLTPVTHENLPLSAAPGQMTVKEINIVRAKIGAIQPLKYFVCGSPISHSRSPAIHTAAFRTLGLPHSYTRLETTRAEDVAARLRELGNEFGGANVTIPLKEAVIAIVDTLSAHASAIGAVNTIIPLGNGRYLGDNTDWVGIRDAFALHGIPCGSPQKSALIIGAGGTALAAVYAFHSMGFGNVYVLNRTRPRAEKLVERFQHLLNVHIVEDADSVPPITAALSCIPGDRHPPEEMIAAIEALLRKPLADNRRQVLVEAAYKPEVTSVMHLAAQYNWTTVPGREMLVYQGVESLGLWTGLKAPQAMARSVLGDAASTQAELY